LKENRGLLRLSWFSIEDENNEKPKAYLLSLRLFFSILEPFQPHFLSIIFTPKKKGGKLFGLFLFI